MLWLSIFLSIIVIALLTRIFLMHKSIRAIHTAFSNKRRDDTNTLISISTNDKEIRLLTNEINIQLRGLRKQQQQYLNGDREIKDAITNISHDLRTPLTAISGYLELLEKEERSTSAERYIEVIKNRVEALESLTEELFKYSVISTAQDSNHVDPVIINDVLEQSVAAFYTALHEHNITPNISLPESKVNRNLNRSSLSRVFSNLLSNAIKYSDGDLEITLSKAGEITFCNTASGLSEVQVGKLFDRFYTVETARKSTGLGLTIARTLVEQLGGSITAKYENSKLSICILFPSNREIFEKF